MTTIDLSVDTLKEPGVYDAVLEDAWYESFKPSRKHPRVARLRWTFRVVGGEHDGRLIEHVTEMDRGSLWLVQKTLYGLGLDPYKQPKWEFEIDDDGGRVVAPDLAGTRAIVDLRLHDGRFPRVRVRRPKTGRS